MINLAAGANPSFPVGSPSGPAVKETSRWWCNQEFGPRCGPGSCRAGPAGCESRRVGGPGQSTTRAGMAVGELLDGRLPVGDTSACWPKPSGPGSARKATPTSSRGRGSGP